MPRLAAAMQEKHRQTVRRSGFRAGDPVAVYAGELR
jgi:hypothetical protein